MKKNQLVLLLSKENSYLVSVKKGKFHTKDGIFNLEELFKKNFGDRIKTHLGKEFIVVNPRITDLLENIERLPQIVMPKDAALILAYTGIGPGSLVVDAGTGSGYLALFLANYVYPGKVITYESNKKFAKIAIKNIKLIGLKNIKLKQKDITKGIEEKNVDLITLDLKDAEKVVEHAYKALKTGGWLVVYSPYIEQVSSVVKKMEEKGFCSIKTVENIVREWQVEKYTRPKTLGLMHTGWLTFGRKVGK
ncbi:MAG: tRNA (adenine-N1)-methyltransferase [Candidatus Aenigmarchaeota archaeon]|nr:tRNA (adenine-N1)-methyltransferase [Candidatus Aenigmarchaeota archaeon]